MGSDRSDRSDRHVQVRQSTTSRDFEVSREVPLFL
ncbi:hypothetical protein L249_3309, partial [Ophiocordyceps polyrhachis-furcata BCC 54312]